jgi:hypothetical protein
MIQRPIGEEEIRPIGDQPVAVEQQQVADPLQRDLNNYLLTRDENAPEGAGYARLSRMSVDNLIESSLFTEEMQQDRVQRRTADMQEKLQDTFAYPDLAYDYLISAADPEVDLNDFRYSVNTANGLELVRRLRETEAAEGGVVDAVMDFGAFILRESTTGIPYNLTRGSEEFGREFAQRRLTMRPSEFLQWLEGYATQVMTQGPRDQNAWNIDQLENELTNNGYDPAAGLNQAFAVLDLTGLIGGAAKLARAGTRAATTIGRTAVTEGVEEAAEVATERLSRIVEEDVLADVGPQSLNPNRNDLGISQSAYSRIMAQNEYIRETQDLTGAGTFGKIVDDPELQARVAPIIDKVVTEFTARTGYRAYQTPRIETDNLGTYFVGFDIGKVDGNPFKATPTGKIPANIEDKARQLGGRARFVDPENTDSGIVISVRQNFSTAKLIDDLDIFELNDIETNLFAKLMNNPVFASSTARGVDALSVAIQRGEAGAAKLNELFNRRAEVVTKLNATERARMDVITNLRDGAGTSQIREWWSEEDFVKYYQSRYGSRPSQKEIDAYNVTVEMSDAAWILQTTNTFKRYVDLDYKAVDTGNGFFSPAKTVNKASIPDDANILDLQYKGNIRKADFREETEVAFYKLDRALDDGTEYVANPQAVRELEPADVTGYNAGGIRVNPQARYFVVTGDGTRTKTLLTARTEKQAKQAQLQIDTIRQAQQNGTLTDDLIRANNDWNPDIQNVTDFDAFAAKHNWRFYDDVPVAYKQRDQPVIAAGRAVDDTIEANMNIFDFAQTSMRRGNQVLPDFGGGAAYNVDTITAVQQQLASVSNKYAFNVYTQKAMIGWVETAKKTGRATFPPNIHPSDYRNLFLRAEITGNDATSARLREIRNIERRRMGIDSELGQQMTLFGERVAEYVFDAADSKMAKTLRLSTALRSDFLQGLITDPSSVLLRVGFTTVFGFFNFAQLLVQSIHAVSIAAISKQGIKGAAMAMTLRGMYHTTPEALEEGLKRAARYYNFSPEKMREVYDYVRTSGRDVIEGEAVELGTGAEYGFTKFRGQDMTLSALDRALYNGTKAGRRLMDKGLAFYRAGERASRMTGVYTAIAEYVEKFPTRSLASEHARNWITRREQNLTLNMTTASRGFGQAGLARVPTQWLSYSFRAMEAIFVGRGFTRGERARLATSLTAFYGLSGFGAERAAEELSEMFGIEQDSAAYTTLKWGVIDGVMDALLGEGEGDTGRVGTGLAPRLSVLQGIKQLYNDVMTGSFLEVIGGPSGQIGASLVDAGVNVFGSLISNQPMTLTNDVLELVRQPSGIDNVFKAVGIFNNGLLVSKSGVPIPAEMSPTEGILALFGVATLKQTEWYTTRTQVFADERSVNTFRREMNSRAETAYRLMQNGDERSIRRGLELLAEVNAQITFSGLSPEQMMSIRRSVASQDEDQFNRLMQTLLRYDREAATSLQTVLR